MVVDAVLVYDRDCGVCRLAKDLLRVLDRGGRIQAVALQDAKSGSLLAGIDEGDRWDSFHFLRNGRTTSRGDGVLEIIGSLPLGGGVPRLAAEVPIVRRLSSRLYGILHRVRDGLDCGVTPRGCGELSGSV